MDCHPALVCQKHCFHFPLFFHRKHAYELLINVDRAARLEWRPYSRYGGVAEGAVAAVDESSSSVVGDNDVFIGDKLLDSFFIEAVIFMLGDFKGDI